MEEESFIDAFNDVPTDLAGDYSPLFIFRAEDFGAWCRRVRNAHEREVDGGVDNMTDADLAEHGLVRLPKDTGGKYIHIGDVMEWCDSGETLTVEGIGRDVLFYIDQDSNECEWTAARNKRHHHYEPTVEDVLFEFARFWSDEELTDIEHLQPHAAQTIAEYAAKLRLRGDAE